MSSKKSAYRYISVAFCGAFLGVCFCLLVWALVVFVCSATVSRESLDQAGWALISLFLVPIVGACGGAIVGVLLLRRRDKGV